MDEFDSWRSIDFARRAIPDDPTGNGDPDFLKLRIPEIDLPPHDCEPTWGEIGPWVVILASIGFIVLGSLSW